VNQAVALRHRRDIDGLRALAVAPVVLFHAGTPGASGGYVGVDIFFVISGFLITGLLIREAQSGTSSIVGFYERRVRRIFPALFAVLIVTSIAAFAIMLPSELATYAKNLIATLLFVSNIAFWQASGYFDAPSEFNPLLHMWSLALEEQFYLLFPLALWTIYRLRLQRQLPWILLAGAAASLALAAVLIRGPVNATFYLLPTRAWELLLGAWLATTPRHAPGGRLGRELTGAIGIALILYAVVSFTPATGVPGAAGLAPCLGALFVIWSGEKGDTWTARVLSSPLLAGVGLISYSLYLWHWPLLTLPRIALMRELSGLEAAAAVGAAVALAAVSWRWIEQPIRRPAAPGRSRSAARSLTAGLGATGLGLAVAAGLLGGAPWRLPQTAVALDRIGVRPDVLAACVGITEAETITRCLARPTTGAKVILWGDSHARQYADALASILAARGGELRVAARPGCAPMLGLTPGAPGRSPDAGCLAFNESVLQSIRSDPNVRGVVLGGRWSRFFFEPTDPEFRLAVAADGAVLNGERLLRTGLVSTLEALDADHAAITLVGQAPEFDVVLPQCLARAAWGRLAAEDCRFKPETLPDAVFSTTLESIVAAHPRVNYVDPAETLCPAGACGRTISGHPVTWDTDHLSTVAAARVADSSGALLR